MARIVLTGGASGLGAAITERLAAAGTHTLLFSYHRSADAAAQLAARHAGLQPHPLDFRDAASVERFALALEAFAPDVLIHNATTGLSLVHAHKLAPEAYLERFTAEVLPVIALTNRALARFRKQKAGRIITVLTDGLVGAPPLGFGPYVATKAYLEALAKSWAVENAPYGISSNCVLPAMMDTPLVSGLDERLREQIAQAQPARRLVRPEEAAELVEFLVGCSPAVNGARLVVNGARQLL
jgi:NAD(P)-dependent dehydrogenase (short-subunit alcohol dehydrogenase family)